MSNYILKPDARFARQLKMLFAKVAKQGLENHDIESRLEYFRNSIESGTTGGRLWQSSIVVEGQPHLINHVVNFFGHRLVLLQNTSAKRIYYAYVDQDD